MRHFGLLAAGTIDTNPVVGDVRLADEQDRSGLAQHVISIVIAKAVDGVLVFAVAPAES